MIKGKKRTIESAEEEAISVLREDGKALISHRIQSSVPHTSSSFGYSMAKAALIVFVLGVLGLLGGYIGKGIHTRNVVETEMEYLVDSIMKQPERGDALLIAINPDPREEMAAFVEELWEPRDSSLEESIDFNSD